MTRPRSATEAARIATYAADDLARIGGDLPALWARLASEETSPLKAASYGDGPRGGRVDEDGHALPDHGDPTGTAATNNATRDSDLRLFATDLAALHGVMARISATHQRFMRDRKTVPPVDTGLEPGGMWCRSCWRIDDHSGHPTKRPVAGNYSKPGLCNWCGEHKADPEFPADHAGLPPVELVETMQRRGRVSTRDVEQWRRGAASGEAVA